MKKYTKRFKQDLKEFRFVKNLSAIGMMVYAATHTIVLSCCSIEDLLIRTGYAISIAVIGEMMFNTGMTVVETAESIQEKHETI